MGCKSSQPRGFGYMAKPPSGAERFRAELEEQAHLTNETRRQNIELNLQVHDLQDQLAAERQQRARDLEHERSERERVEAQFEEKLAERDRLLEEKRTARKSELQALKQSMMAEMAKMMGTQQMTIQQMPQQRDSQRSSSSNVARSLFQNTSSNVSSGTLPRMITSHQLKQAAKPYQRPAVNMGGRI